LSADGVDRMLSDRRQKLSEVAPMDEPDPADPPIADPGLAPVIKAFARAADAAGS
jgi:hypothetical protein